MTQAATSSSFTQAARKRETYVFRLDRFAADFYAAQPEWKGRLFFIDTRFPTPYWVDDGTDSSKLRRSALEQDKVFAPTLRESHTTGEALTIRNDQEDYACIFINTRGWRKDLPLYTGPEGMRHHENFLMMERELGRVLHTDGMGKGNRSESIVNGYMMIRYLHAFGPQAPQADNIVHMNISDMVFRPDNGVHYSPVLLARILSDRETIVASSGTRAQAMDMAESYARAHAQDKRRIVQVSHYFDGLKNRLPDIARGDIGYIWQLRQNTLSAPDKDTYHCGATALKALLDGRIMCNGRQVMPKGEQWQEIRETLNQYEAGRRRFEILQQP